MNNRSVRFATLLIFVISCQFALAQDGILFQEGDWATIKAKAKAANRPIFIDVFTSWCGPCKKMAKEVFPLSEVGSKFNSMFVNYKIDAEKGEGVEIAKKFKVNSFPTYLFVTGDEVLVYRSLGSMPTEKFLSEAALAFTEFKDPMPLAGWEDNYEPNKNDSSYLRKYLNKRKKLRLNSADLLDQYFIVMGPTGILQSDLLPDLGLYLNLNTDGPFYEFLAANAELVKETIFKKTKRNVLMKEYLVVTAKNDVERAIAKKDEKLLQHISRVLLQLPADEWPIEWRSGELKMKYFSQTKNSKELVLVLNSYGTQLVGVDKKKIAAIDSSAVAKFDADLAAGKLPNIKPENIASNRMARATINSNSYAYKVRDLAKSVFNVIDDKGWLNKALKWMDTASMFSNNFTIDETRASILYKLGKQKDAILVQQKAIDNFLDMQARMNISNDKIVSRLTETLRIMKEGKPTWN